ncbi:PAS domain S-box protein [candidate division KSB1 bacterium]|nr:PAS domain S-box protein [candidate division KSB1 bacterium]
MIDHEKKQPKILIVDDEIAVAKVIQKNLLQWDYLIVGIATTIQEAIRMIDEQSPNLVLMDIKLEGDIDGIRIAKYIHNNHDIPVIYLTAHYDTDLLEFAKQTEPFAYLLKPFSQNELHSTIEIVLSKFQIEKKLKQSENKFRHLAELSPAIIYIIQAGKLVYSNLALRNILGYTTIEIQNKSVFDLMDIEDKTSFIKQAIYHQRNLCKHWSEVVKLITKGGEVRQFYCTSSIMEYNDKPAFLGMGQEITEMLEIKKKLSRTENLYQFLYQENPSIYFTISTDGTIQSVNKFGATQLGYTVEELLGKSFYSIIMEEDKQKFQVVLESFRKQSVEILNQKIKLIKNDNSICYARIVSRMIQHPDGSDVVLMDCDDITELVRVQNEKNNLQMQYAHAEKLVTIGQFTAAIAHEINNDLDSLTNVTYLLEKKILKGVTSIESLDYVQKIKHQIDRIDTFSKLILNFVKPHKIDPERLELNRLIRDIVDNLPQKYFEDGIIRLEFCPELIVVNGDRIGLEIVLRNIIINAIQALSQNGQVTVNTSSISDESAQIIVTDNGAGIAAPDLKNIFLPFFSKKDRTIGTGLGLTICNEIIRKHNGQITLSSKIDEGTCVTITLPRY